jgi:hypothetical protein
MFIAESYRAPDEDDAALRARRLATWLRAQALYDRMNTHPRNGTADGCRTVATGRGSRARTKPEGPLDLSKSEQPPGI